MTSKWDINKMDAALARTARDVYASPPKNFNAPELAILLKSGIAGERNRMINMLLRRGVNLTFLIHPDGREEFIADIAPEDTIPPPCESAFMAFWSLHQRPRECTNRTNRTQALASLTDLVIVISHQIELSNAVGLKSLLQYIGLDLLSKEALTRLVWLWSSLPTINPPSTTTIPFCLSTLVELCPHDTNDVWEEFETLLTAISLHLDGKGHQSRVRFLHQWFSGMQTASRSTTGTRVRLPTRSVPDLGKLLTHENVILPSPLNWDDCPRDDRPTFESAKSTDNNGSDSFCKKG